MTPSLGHCTQSCVFCWRATPEIIGEQWNQSNFSDLKVDEPETIVKRCIDAHRKAINGFGGNPEVKEEMLNQANKPLHAAISLEGEPTMYPYLSGLIEAFKKEGFVSVFVVTNGLDPKALSELSPEPTQLYLSVSAPDKETYTRICRPIISNGWKRLNESLEILRSYKCPTVLRHTLVPKFNMNNPEGYAKLAKISDATYIEPKAAMSVGAARKRFEYNEMAWHKDIRNFAEELSTASGYKIIDEKPLSSVVLLSRLEKPIKFFR
jgi:tRNA wybutosine-synthesizing protein 1